MPNEMCARDVGAHQAEHGGRRRDRECRCRRPSEALEPVDCSRSDRLNATRSHRRRLSTLDASARGSRDSPAPRARARRGDGTGTSRADCWRARVPDVRRRLATGRRCATPCERRTARTRLHGLVCRPDEIAAAAAPVRPDRRHALSAARSVPGAARQRSRQADSCSTRRSPSRSAGAGGGRRRRIICSQPGELRSAVRRILDDDLLRGSRPSRTRSRGWSARRRKQPFVMLAAAATRCPVAAAVRGVGVDSRSRR